MTTSVKSSAAPQVVEDCHALLAWLIPQLDKFPRARRFTLGERIESGVLFVLESLIAACYLKQRGETLRAANLRLDVVRPLWRLCHTLRVISPACYGQGAERFTDLGRQIGGWRRQQAEAEHAPSR